MIAPNDWETAKSAFPPGTLVKGTVQAHVPFGVFVNIPDCPFQGLIMLVHFKDAERMTREEFPAVGSDVSAVVIGHKELEHQVVLSVRPSDLNLSLSSKETAAATRNQDHLPLPGSLISRDQTA